MLYMILNLLSVYNSLNMGPHDDYLCMGYIMAIFYGLLFDFFTFL